MNFLRLFLFLSLERLLLLTQKLVIDRGLRTADDLMIDQMIKPFRQLFGTVEDGLFPATSN